MSFRKDLPFLVIPLGSFQNFDQGGEISVNIPESWNLKSGDRLTWECGSNHDGDLEIVCCVGDVRVVRKIS